MPQNSVVTEQRNILHKNRNMFLLQVQKLFWLSAQKPHTRNVTKKFGSFWLRQLNKSGWYNYLFFFFFFHTVKEIYSTRCSLGKFHAPSFFGLCAPCFPTTVHTFHAFTIQLHDLSPLWRPHLSEPNDAWGQEAEESPLCYLPEHATAQKALYRKEPINNTFLSCSLQ